MSRGRHRKPSSLPSASTLAAAAPAVLVVAAAAAPAAHPAGPPAARPDTVPAVAPAASPFAAAQALRAAAAARQAHRAATAAVITVAPGDTLAALAQRHYGHASRWPVIWWANRHLVHNPNLLRAGLHLVLPADPAPTSAQVKAAYAAIPPPPPPPPPPAPVAAPAPAPAASSAPAPARAPVTSGGLVGTGGMSTFQACVIARESGGNPSAVNPSSGAGGLYGFLPSTWQALGFPGLPENATVATQNAAFAQEYAQSGTAAWAPYDGC